MPSHNYDSLSVAMNDLGLQGYTESFITTDDCFQAVQSKKKYQPNELLIIQKFRFDGFTNPSDESELFAIEASDGTKGTLVMSYSAQHNHNVELIKKIREAN